MGGDGGGRIGKGAGEVGEVNLKSRSRSVDVKNDQLSSVRVRPLSRFNVREVGAQEEEGYAESENEGAVNDDVPSTLARAGSVVRKEYVAASRLASASWYRYEPSRIVGAGIGIG